MARTAPPGPMAAAMPPPTTLTDLQTLIAKFSEEKIIYFSPTGKLLEAPTPDKTAKYDREGVIALKIKPLLDDELTAINKLVDDIDAPRRVAKPAVPGQPAVAAGFMDEYDFLDPDYQKKMREGRRLQRAAIIVGGLVDLKIDGATIQEKAAFLSKNFPARLLDFLREEIEAISSGEIKALDLASFT